jgi:hypothetical protein
MTIDHTRTRWLMECVGEGVPSMYLGTSEFVYQPPALETDPHTLSVVFGNLYIAEGVAVELIRLWVARTQSVKRDKVKAVPFSERDGNGPVRRGYQITWYQADVMLCGRCWYAVNQIRCDHPFLRATNDNRVDNRASLTEWAWAQCGGHRFVPRVQKEIHTTAEAVFGD